MRWGLRPRLAVFFLMVTLGAQSAHAQSDRERAAARQAAKEGITAFQQERWNDALKYLERAEQVVHAPTHLLFIARTNVKLGRLIEAREAYQKLINENLSSSAPRAFHNAQESGREEISTIEGRLAKITVEVAGPEGVQLENLQLSVDEEPVPPPRSWISPYRPTPGNITSPPPRTECSKRKKPSRSKKGEPSP